MMLKLDMDIKKRDDNGSPMSPRRSTSKLKREKSRATAFHEAGHAVVAFKLGIALGSRGASINPGDGYDGICHVSGGIGGDPYARSGRLKANAERRVMVSLAGLEAQRRHRPSSVRSYHAHIDYTHAVDFLSPFCESSEELDAWMKLLAIRTRNVVNSPAWWQAIEAIAEALLEQKTIPGPKLTVIIRQASSVLRNSTPE